MIITTGRLLEKQTPESSSFRLDASLTKVAYRDTSYFGASASGLKLEHNTIPSDFVFWTVSNPDDKVRSNLRVGIGDIFTGFAAAEVSASETFFDKKIQPSELVEFRDVFNRKLLSFQQRNVQTSDDLRTYSYQSILTKLNNTYPASFLKKADQTAGNPSSLTAKGWLGLLFAEWATVYNKWFAYEALPELYPRGFSSAVVSEAFTVVQDENSPRSMRSIIDDILALFEGYRLVVTAENKLKIVAPVWSPAYSSGTTTLTNHDLYTYPISLPQDYSNIANKVTVTSERYDFVADQVIIAPSFVPKDLNGATNSSLDDNSANYPTDRERRNSDIPLAENTLVDESEISVQLQCEVYEDFAYKQTKSQTVTLKKDVSQRVAFGYNYVVFGNPSIKWELLFNGKTIRATMLSASDSRNVLGNFAYFSYILLVDATGKKWQPSGVTESGSWSIERTDNQLPGLQSSVDNFGEIEYTVRNSFFDLSIEQLEMIAKATVDELMRPVTRFNLELSIWNQFAGITPEQIGKKIILPSGLEGVITDFAYSDDYEGDTPVVSCIAEITVTEELD
jgi:hypothetical protein